MAYLPSVENFKADPVRILSENLSRIATELARLQAASSGTKTAAQVGTRYSDLFGLPTTLSGFGITNAYTKTEVDSLIGDVGGNIDGGTAMERFYGIDLIDGGHA